MGYRFTIKQARMYADMSADELARAVGVSRSTVSNWENGSVAPRVPQMVLISEVTGVNVDDIFLSENSTKSR